MRTEIIRELGETYLQMDEDMAAGEFIKNMISENKIKGFITPRVLSFNGDSKISYRISGKESLSSRLKRKKYGEEDIKNLIYAMAAAEEECRRYMLPPEGMIMDGDYIFFNYATESYQFIYRMDLGEGRGFKEFAEELIKSPGYFAESAAGFVYGLYEEAGDGITKACAYIRSGDDPPGDFEEEKESMPEEIKPEDDYTYMQELSFKKFILGRFEKKKKESRPPVESDETGDFKREVIFEPEEVNYETEYVDRTCGPYGEFTVRKTGETLPLGKDITAIGKSPDYCDMVIRDESVSRLHAQVIKRDGDYYIADINSKNGVEINGGDIRPGEEILLKRGDVVKLGKCELIFN